MPNQLLDLLEFLLSEQNRIGFGANATGYASGVGWSNARALSPHSRMADHLSASPNGRLTAQGPRIPRAPGGGGSSHGSARPESGALVTLDKLAPEARRDSGTRIGM